MAKTVNLNVKADTKEAEKNLEDVGKKASEAAKESKEIGKAAKDSKKGVNILSAGFKGLGTAMKGAGIGIIIGLAAKLTEVFMENQSVVDATNKAFGTLKVVFQQFTEPLFRMVQGIGAASENFDALLRVGKAVLNIVLTPVKVVFKEIQLGVLAAQLAWEKSFFGDDDPETIKNLEAGLTQVKDDLIQIGKDAVESGKTIVNDFGEAFNEAANIATQTGDAIQEGYKNINLEVAQATAEANVELEKSAILAEARLQGTIEKYDLLAERQRQIRDNETNTIDDRIKANEKLGEILQEQLQVQEDQAQKVLDAARAKLATDEDNIEFQRQVIEAENEVAATRAQIAGFESEQQVNANALLREKQEILNELALIGQTEQERAIAEAEQELQRQQDLIERTISNEEMKNERLLAAKREFEDKVLALTQKQFEEEQKLAKKNADNQNKLEQAKADARISNLQTVAQAVNGISQLIADNAQASKGVAIAEAIINTYAGAAKAIGQGGVFGVVQAAGVIAAGIANVRKIQQTEIPNASGGGGSPSISGGGLGGANPNVQNAFNAGNAQQVEVTNTQDQTIRAYVLEGEVTSSQEAASRLQRKSEL